MFTFRRIRRTRRIRRSRKSPNRPDYLARKEVARELVMERLEHFTEEYARLDAAQGTVNADSMKYSRVSIRNQRSRWGSCSSKKNLNFNYRVLDLSPELRDYVIAHELCHLKELHHGQAFWELLAKVIPNVHECNRKTRSMKIT
jgi:predicted metal-dependent hydrolase